MAESRTHNKDTLLFCGSATKDGIRDLLAGMASGFVCRILEYPFDTIKVGQRRVMLTNVDRSRADL